MPCIFLSASYEYVCGIAEDVTQADVLDHYAVALVCAGAESVLAGNGLVLINKLVVWLGSFCTTIDNAAALQYILLGEVNVLFYIIGRKDGEVEDVDTVATFLTAFGAVLCAQTVRDDKSGHGRVFRPQLAVAEIDFLA